VKELSAAVEADIVLLDVVVDDELFALVPFVTVDEEDPLPFVDEDDEILPFIAATSCMNALKSSLSTLIEL
jgi:hypothetical protein